MHTLRFGRKLTLSSTFAIKHQIRKLMAEEETKKALAKAEAESTDIRPVSVDFAAPPDPDATRNDQPFAAVLATASSAPAAQALAKP